MSDVIDTKIDDVKDQWEKFLDENSPNNLPVVDEDILRERIIKELT